MVVNVASVTSAHPLELARELANRGRLGTYYTAVPKTRTPRVPSARVKRHLSLLPAIWVSMRPWSEPFRDPLFWRVNHEFDRWIASHLTACDVQHFLPGCGLKTLRTARKQFDALTVCDTTTGHIRTASDILRAEAARWKLPYTPPGAHWVNRLEAEYEESDLITAPSTFAMETFIKQGVPRRKLALTAYGADLADYSPVAKEDETFRILFVGALTFRKGLQYLVEAMNGLKFRNAELVLRGVSASDTATLLAQYRGVVPLRIVDSVPKSMMKWLYSQASVLILPSVEDAFGLVIGQAMACGVPVIASTQTGGPDMITDGIDGYIVRAGDSEAIAERLTQLYENPDDRSRMQAAALRRVQALGGWKEYGSAVVRAYEGAAVRLGRSA